MNNKLVKMKTLWLALVFLTVHSLQADVLYLENFTGELGKGAIGPGGSSPTTDLSGVDWSIDITDVNMTAAGDFFQVIDQDPGVGVDEVFEALDPGGEAIWYSPSIDVSGYTDFLISFDLTAPSSNYDKTTEIFQVFYNLDGAGAVKFFDIADYWSDTVGDNDGIPNGIFSSPELATTGSSLTISVFTDIRSGAHRVNFDDVQVTGTVIPEPSSLMLIVSAIGAMMFMAKRRKP